MPESMTVMSDATPVSGPRRYRPLFTLDPNVYTTVPPPPMRVVHKGWWRTTVTYVDREELERQRLEAEQHPRQGFIRRLAAWLSPARS